MNITKILAVTAFLGMLYSQARADLIDLRYNGSSWVANTVAAGDFNVVSQSSGLSNSVSVASISTSQVFRYNNINTTPTVITTNGLAVTDLVSNQDAPGGNAGRQTALVGGKTYFIDPAGGAAATGGTADTTWQQLFPIAKTPKQTNWYVGIKDNGEVSRFRFSGGWDTENVELPRAAGPVNNYAYITYEANTPSNYIMLAGDQGVDRIYFSGTWIAQEVTDTTDYTVLAPVSDDRSDVDTIYYGTYASGSVSGLDRIYYDSTGAVGGSVGFHTQDINDNTYIKLATDMTQPYTLFGLREGGVDLIQSTDLGVTWTTTTILNGNFTDIAANFDVSNSVFVTSIPEPGSLGLLGLGVLCIFARRRS